MSGQLHVDSRPPISATASSATEQSPPVVQVAGGLAVESGSVAPHHAATPPSSSGIFGCIKKFFDRLLQFLHSICCCFGWDRLRELLNDKADTPPTTPALVTNTSSGPVSAPVDASLIAKTTTTTQSLTTTESTVPATQLTVQPSSTQTEVELTPAMRQSFESTRKKAHAEAHAWVQQKQKEFAALSEEARQKLDVSHWFFGSTTLAEIWPASQKLSAYNFFFLEAFIDCLLQDPLDFLNEPDAFKKEKAKAGIFKMVLDEFDTFFDSFKSVELRQFIGISKYTNWARPYSTRITTSLEKNQNRTCLAFFRQKYKIAESFLVQHAYLILPAIESSDFSPETVRVELKKFFEDPRYLKSITSPDLAAECIGMFGKEMVRKLCWKMRDYIPGVTSSPVPVDLNKRQSLEKNALALLDIWIEYCTNYYTVNNNQNAHDLSFKIREDVLQSLARYNSVPCATIQNSSLEERNKMLFQQELVQVFAWNDDVWKYFNASVEEGGYKAFFDVVEAFKPKPLAPVSDDKSPS